MDDQRPNPWRILASTYPISTPFLRLRSDTIELPDGLIIQDYFVRETRGFSVIFALTPERDVVLVRQYKHGVQQYVVELPAGAIDPGESARDCAVRELAEETGYVGDEPEHVHTFLADPTNSNGSFHVYLIRNAVKTREQSLDSTEAIEVEFAPVGRLTALIADGTINSGSQAAAVYITLAALAAD